MIIWKYGVSPLHLHETYPCAWETLSSSDWLSYHWIQRNPEAPSADRPKTVPVNLPQYPGAEASNYSTSATQQSQDALKPWGIGEIGNIELPETPIIGFCFQFFPTKRLH